MARAGDVDVDRPRRAEPPSGRLGDVGHRVPEGVDDQDAPDESAVLLLHGAERPGPPRRVRETREAGELDLRADVLERAAAVEVRGDGREHVAAVEGRRDRVEPDLRFGDGARLAEAE